MPQEPWYTRCIGEVEVHQRRMTTREKHVFDNIKRRVGLDLELSLQQEDDLRMIHRRLTKARFHS